jgi:putative chitinase
MNYLTTSQVKDISYGRANMTMAMSIVNILNDNLEEFKVDTPSRMAFFLGHCAVESTYFTRLEENLYYSAKRLRQVWPNRFPNYSVAKKYAKNPRALANYVYNGRMGNRSGTDDGWNYRGGGIKQLTGAYNYNEFNKWIHKQSFGKNAPDFVRYPEEVRRMPWAIYSAVWYWLENKVYLYAGKGQIRASTKAINGGYNGLKQRTTAINRARKILITDEGPAKTKKAPSKPNKLLMEYQGKLNRISELKGRKAFHVGKVDGWNGTKTTKAAKAFQKYAGLNVDGVIGKNTREAIDNVLELLEQPIEMAPAELISSYEEETNEVVEVPADIPEELESKDKPLFESKTVLSYVFSGGTMVTAVLNGAWDWFVNADPIVQAGMILLVIVTIVLSFMAIRDRIRVKRGVDKLKKDKADSESYLEEVASVIFNK